ncbi:hypothetical protein PK98_14190 [Croceibacterium mercuriale]|uniref:HEPN domain-containing protein n=1 Tax=Croceibacterium mercuriale TaxID=1572751 RepID=A0A0B2BTV2_9SPHN|nr:hypothetical protein [Croceibacterium mercuriale]KHL24988.1 hypothetical protein PK98_14190 [Croceibacterium mercuriale]
MNEDYARDLWHMGASHALAAAAVARRAQEWAEVSGAENPEIAVTNGRYSPSIFLLIGYSLEILLKTACIAHGSDPKELRDIGHDLEAALTSAERLGFCSSAPQLRKIVELLRQPHREHHFRYSGMDDFPLPADVDEVLGNLNHLAWELEVMLFPQDP